MNTQLKIHKKIDCVSLEFLTRPKATSTMKSIIVSLGFALATLNSIATAAAIPSIRDAPRSWPSKKPAAFFLAGDSTTAAQSGAGGGKFLNINIHRNTLTIYQDGE